jgi:hypothetical protein
VNVNWRALGCGLLAAVVFVAVGIFGISRALTPAECPDQLPYQPSAYRPVGEPMSSPALDGGGELVRAGSTSFGLAAWDVWVPEGEVPQASGAALPEHIVLACGDGSYQAYQRGTE